MAPISEEKEPNTANVTYQDSDSSVMDINNHIEALDNDNTVYRLLTSTHHFK